LADFKFVIAGSDEYFFQNAIVNICNIYHYMIKGFVIGMWISDGLSKKL